MPKEFEAAYDDVLEKARTVVAELEEIDPENISRENWEHQFTDYMDYRRSQRPSVRFVCRNLSGDERKRPNPRISSR
ncbi:hypothetical protein [Halorussus ruber]|uniref:hypothetical protein n=1 Tax=Halorussus ruber TaxID=1126238 RepID=UPI0010920481|nr:hypothetical protein [Halorussus ruber]